MKVYISGPMSGKVDFNMPTFNEAARELRSLGYEVTNPVDLDTPEVKEALKQHPDGTISEALWQDCLSRDVTEVLQGGYDSIVLLPEWAESRGAMLEVAAALFAGVKTFYIRFDTGRMSPVELQDVAFVLCVGLFGWVSGEDVTEVSGGNTIH